MIACAIVACVLALDQSGPLTLACKGTPDFSVALDLALGRLLAAPVADAHSFALRDAGDAVIFFRDRVFEARKAFEWISISRVSGRYAHFIAFRDASGGLESSRLMAAARCEIAT